MRKTSTKSLCLIGLFSALLCICSWISIPSAIPFTLQTFAVFLILFIFNDCRAVFSILIYILLGAVGVPVFSDFQGGIGRLFGPTGGFIFGFLFIGAAYVLTTKLFGRNKIVRLIGMSVGLMICYIAGALWFSYVTGKSFSSAFGICITPFIIPDILKLVFAYFVSSKIRKITIDI